MHPLNLLTPLATIVVARRLLGALRSNWRSYARALALRVAVEASWYAIRSAAVFLAALW